MKHVKYLWLFSLIAGVLLFIDDIAGVDTENGEGLVVANNGLVTGSLSWPLLGLAGMIFVATSLILVFRPKSK